MRRIFALSLALFLFAALAAPARADWPAAGDTLYGNAHPVFPMTAVLDGAGGVLAWWGNYAGGAPAIVRAARVAAGGAVYPSWDETNPPAGSNVGADGAGGVFRTWSYTVVPTGYVYVDHVRAAGGLDPAWPAAVNVITTTSGLSQLSTVASDGAGGAFVTWGQLFNVYVRRVLANGTIAPGWPTGGRILDDPFTQSYASTPNVIVPDGAGGAYVAWMSLDAQVTRVDGSGAFASGWAAGGLDLGGDGDGTGAQMVSLLPSGANGMIAFWTDASGATAGAWLQRFQSDGTLDPAWPASGRFVAGGSTACPDGAGGAYVAWTGGGGVRGVRVLSTGSIAPGWSASGNVLTDAGAVIGALYPPQIAVATGPDDGLVLCWNDTRNGRSLVHARWFHADGSADPAMADSGIVVSDGVSAGYVLGATGDGAGGAYVGWQLDTGFNWYQTMLSHVPHPTTVSVPATPRAVAALAAPWPNPARDAVNVAFTLAGRAPATLELLDLAGRRVRAVQVSGAGRRVERFDRLAALAPGVYVVRLAEGAWVRTARVAILR